MASLEIGYSLSSEEHEPRHLVRWAQRAEAAGFGFALISDHYHPWIDKQGQSPFVCFRFYQERVLPELR